MRERNVVSWTADRFMLQILALGWLRYLFQNEFMFSPKWYVNWLAGADPGERGEEWLGLLANPNYASFFFSFGNQLNFFIIIFFLVNKFNLPIL